MFRLTNYQIIGEPLKGGMGVVYHIHHHYWNRHIAMKQPLEEFCKTERGKKRFFKECERWISLGVHENIVQCYFVVNSKGIPTAFMEWMEKGTLSDAMKSGEFYKGSEKDILKRIIRVSLEMAEGLHYAHQKGMVHLDVKPSNVLRDEKHYKISDFGLASLLSEEKKSLSYTPLYCAPEQYEKKETDARTDIYSWAVTVLHMFVRKAGWMNGSVAGSGFSDIIERSVIKVPPAFYNILKQCLSYNKNDRPDSFASVINQLITLYEKEEGIPYKKPESSFEAVSLNAANNIAISYFHLGKEKEAALLWQKSYWRNPYQLNIYYNYHLYLYRYIGTMMMDFTESTETNQVFHENHFHDALLSDYHKSMWQYSAGAFASAYAYAKKAKEKSESLFGKSKDIFHACFDQMTDTYHKYGPKALKTLDVKKILKIEEVWKDCVHVAAVCGKKHLYVRKNGEAFLIDFQAPKIVKYQTGCKNIICAATSRDGKYLAVCEKKEDSIFYEIRVVSLPAFGLIYHIKGSHFKNGPKFLAFTKQEKDVPRLAAVGENTIFDWNLSNNQKPVHTEEDEEGTYQKIAKENMSSITGFCEGKDGCLIVKAKNSIRIYDPILMEIMGEHYSTSFEKMKPYEMHPVSDTYQVVFLDEEGGFVVYDYMEHRIVTQDHFKVEGVEKIYMLSLASDGKQMILLCGNAFQIRVFPDYKKLPDPLFLESSVDSTELILERHLSYENRMMTLRNAFLRGITKQEKAAKLNDKVVEVKLHTLRSDTRRNYPMHSYYELAALMAQVYGFKEAVKKTFYSNEEKKCFAMKENGMITDSYGNQHLAVERNGLYLDLVDAKTKRIILEKFCYEKDFIGLSDDYCYIVCENRSRNGYRYRITSLEWQLRKDNK